MISFNASTKSLLIERSIYTLFDLFGDIGGIAAIVTPFIQFIVSPFSSNNINSLIARKLFLSRPEKFIKPPPNTNPFNVLDRENKKKRETFELFKRIEPLKSLLCHKLLFYLI